MAKWAVDKLKHRKEKEQKDANKTLNKQLELLDLYCPVQRNPIAELFFDKTKNQARCPTCSGVFDPQKLAKISHRDEYRISGVCGQCQDQLFK